MLLVECNVLEQVKVIKEGTEGNTRLRLRGKFQQCDEQNNNGRIYPRKILEAQVQAIQEKIGDRSLVGALDHPANDAIHLSQASHLITGLSVGKNGEVIGECEILSTPNGKIVEALINDGVKIGISSRGVGSVTEGIKGKIVNEDFKLITFDLVSDPSTRGAFPELSESMRENSERAQAIVSKHKKDRVLLTMLESKISEALKGKRKKLDKNKNGKLDSEDFEILRGEKKVEEGVHATKATSDQRIARRAAVQRGRAKQASKAFADTGGMAALMQSGVLADPVRRKNRQADRARDNTAKEYARASAARMSGQQSAREAVIEGLKKVCWGDRYDEGEVKRRNKAKKKRALAVLGAGELAKGKLFTPTERAGSYETYRKSGGKEQTGNVVGKGRAKLRKKFGSANEAVVEGLKKVCWGPRYDENQGQFKGPKRGKGETPAAYKVRMKKMQPGQPGTSERVFGDTKATDTGMQPAKKKK